MDDHEEIKKLIFYMKDETDNALWDIVQEACRVTTPAWRAYEELRSRFDKSERLREFWRNPLVGVIPDWEKTGPRERQALQLKIRGLTLEESASVMDISDRTVKNMIWNVVHKRGMYAIEIIPLVLKRIGEILDEPV